MERLARHIRSQLQLGEWMHCAVYEHELQRLWPLGERDREAKMAQFAKEYGFRLRYYSKGICAIFDEWPGGLRI
ncbi:MAG: hypothetical protein DME90_00225 [Verrucomicrobia bacterium]|nr:MAG: hypothetical protein DME90_00225 [Verrucomicrobiota bacterium]